MLFVRTAVSCVLTAGVVAILSACAQLDSLGHALDPSITDREITYSYTVPTLTPTAGSQSVEILDGLELQIVAVPVAATPMLYRASIAPDNTLFTLNSSPPRTSADPVWNSFYTAVYQSHGSLLAGSTIPGNSDAYHVVLAPVVDVVPDRLRFRITVTNRTTRILNIDIAPTIAVDGKLWDEKYAFRIDNARAIDPSTRDNAALKSMFISPSSPDFAHALPSELRHTYSLAPGATETWEFAGPWLSGTLPQTDSSGGTLVLEVSNVVVNPVTLKRDDFRFVFDYSTKQFSRQAPEKSGTMVLDSGVASALNGQTFQ